MEQSNLSMDMVSMIAKLADLKDEHYRNTLAISTMLELLVDKGVFTREEMEKKAAELDQFMAYSPYPMA
ncbi:hypothetical protein [Paenibacillus sp. IHBB 10380]|jgi:hypothetical protein|uniref:hypothetical protein n=1 Tax=Paenibacillus sp. IHBB 10380 TaxID=1566358 RepID=UPI0005CFBD13|nr:hypothetical protein [Paenibacillus sp. IHBB 10380]AJS60661.1 hypothetical protein UB51_21860 [Paenibacillus sp. IHBB 10380]